MEDVTDQASVSQEIRRRLEQPEWQAMDQLPLTQLEQAYLRQVNIENLLIFTPLLILVPFAGILLNLPGLLILGLAGVTLIIATLVSFIRYRQALVIAYGVFEHEFVMQKGIFWHKKTALPYTRLQHVSLSQGPLERFFKQHTLRCFSAGSGSAEISLPGLNSKQAEPLRQHLLTKASLSQQADLDGDRDTIDV